MHLLNLFFPNRCPFCDDIISSTVSICNNCSKKYPIGCIKNEFYFQKDKFINISPYFYELDIKKSIWKFKFRNHKEYAKSFAYFISQAIKKSDTAQFEIITSVPISKERISERGYNQTELFAKELAAIFKVKYQILLKKVKNNLEQHTLSLEKRRQNVTGAYSALRPDIIKGKKILLCDDIITTGNTIGECKKILLEAGANSVTCATIATAQNQRNKGAEKFWEQI